MMKRIIVNIILMAAFVFLMTVITLSFVAELRYQQAKKLEGNYRWKKAEQVYKQVIRLDFLNAKYFSEYGDFLMRRGQYYKNKTDWLRRAEDLHEHACRLNPGYAEYRFLLGEVKLQLADLDGLGDFRKAVKLDPYNLRMNYLIGLSLVSVWEILDMEGKSFAVDRLSYVLQLRPDYAGYFYHTIMDYTEGFPIAEKIVPGTLSEYEKLYRFIKKNNLWQLRKQVWKRLAFYREKEEQEKFKQGKEERQRLFRELRSLAMTGRLKGWVGKSKEGNVYESGGMYWERTVNAVVDMPGGKSVISIKAKGSPADGIFPYMVVELDGEEVGETFIDGADWKEYFFQVDTDGGIMVLSVTFVNDGANEEKGEDRNLHVGKVRVE